MGHFLFKVIFYLLSKIDLDVKDLVKALKPRTLLQCHNALAVKPWPRQSTSLSLSFLISKIDIVIPALHMSGLLLVSN